MKLPLLISVPHAGLAVPPEAEPYNALPLDAIRADGDVGASAIYAIDGEVDAFVSTDVARAFVDLNRARDDRHKDGVVKTHTCWDVPVYHTPLPEPVVEHLLDRHWRPFHDRLTDAASPSLVLAIDCHTMAANGPPVGPDPGQRRPELCLSDVNGRSCPAPLFARLRDALAEAFAPFRVAVNEPFRGGYITRTHAAEMPWVQLEFSRAPFLTDDEKRTRLLDALRRFVAAQAR